MERRGGFAMKMDRKERFEEKCIRRDNFESLWDRLPLEMQDAILSRATPLTQLLHGRLGPARELDDAMATKVWREALQTDWEGDLATLRVPEDLEWSDLMLVRSRRMLRRLASLFPRCGESNPAFRRFDAARNGYEIPKKFEASLGRHQEEDVLNSLDQINQEHHEFQEHHKLQEQEVKEHLEFPHEMRLLHVAMRRVWLDELGDALKRHPLALAQDAIAYGHEDLLRHLHDSRVVDLRRLRVVRSNATPLVHHRMRHRLRLPIDVAAACGHLHIIKLIHDKIQHLPNEFDNNKLNGRDHYGIVCSRVAMDAAAAAGHLHVVQWLHFNRDEGCTAHAMDAAAANGHLHVVEWLHRHRDEGCSVWAANDAAANGHTHVLRFLLDSRSEGFSHHGVAAAIANDRLAEAAMLIDSVSDHQNRRHLLERAGLLVPRCLL